MNTDNVLKSTSSMSGRNSILELFRFFLIYGVCVLHLLYYGVGLIGLGRTDVQASYENLLLMVIVLPAVNCFMLISGYFGIRLNMKKLFVMLTQCWMVYAATMVLRYGVGLFGGGNFHIADLIHIFPVSTKVWWFMTEYITIMLLSPIINEGLSRLNRCTFLVVLIGLGFVSSIGLYVSLNHTGSDLLGMLFIYLLGRYMRQEGAEQSRRSAMLIWMASSILLYACAIALWKLNLLKAEYVLFHYCNPLIIAQSIGIFSFALSFKPISNKCFNWLGRHCLTIYLFTEITNFYFYQLWASIYQEYSLLICLFAILVSCLAIMSVDILILHASVIIGNKVAGMKSLKNL